MRVIFKATILSVIALCVFSIFSEDANVNAQINIFDEMLEEDFVQNYEPEFYNENPDSYLLHNPKRLSVKKIAPKYPAKAARKNKTGTVLVGYEILSNGTVSNIEIIEEYPKGVGFGKASVSATKKFTYEKSEKLDEAESTDVVYSLNRFTFSLETGGGNRRDLNNLIDSANSGDAKSIYEMATVAPSVYKIKLATEKTNELILKSAILSNPQAQLNLGLRLFSGYGMEKDRAKSKNWLELSSSNGNVFASDFLEEYAKSF